MTLVSGSDINLTATNAVNIPASVGLTFGADKKIGDNKFGGFALRYAQNDASVSYINQSSEMESLTLNLYGIIPKNETYYTNMILGYSLLRIDQKYQFLRYPFADLLN